MSFKIKNQEVRVGKPKIQIIKYKDQRFSFNFSFMTPRDEFNLSKRGKHINKTIRVELINKIWRLSQDDINTVLSYPKKIGLESLPIDTIQIALNSEFEKSGRREDVDEFYWVFRLNKKGRVICMKQKHIIYIISIDKQFKQYQH